MVAEGWTQLGMTVTESLAAQFRQDAKATGPQGVKVCGTAALMIWQSLPSPVRGELYRLVWGQTLDTPNDVSVDYVASQALTLLSDYKHHLRQLVLGQATNPRTVWRVNSADAIDWADGGPWLWELKNELEKLKKSRKGKG